MFNKVKSFVSSAVNTVKSVFSNPKSQTAAALDFNNPYNQALQTSRQNPSLNLPITPGPMTPAPKTLGGKQVGPSAGPMTPNPSGPNYQLPVTISAGKTKSYSGPAGATPMPTSMYSTAAGPTFEGFISSPQRTISSSSLGGGSSSGTFNLASAPSSVNPGKTNTTGLAGTMAGYYTRKEDGTFEPVTEDPFGEKSDEDVVKDKKKLYKDVFGDPNTVYEDTEVIQAQKERRQIQENLKVPTAELNAIVAQQNADLLNLRKIGSQEGVTESVYGNQERSINYDAAIRALPIKAQIASLQGDLELAQDYLTELTTIKKEQIKTQYDYNKGLFDTIYSALDAKEKRVADRLIKENDRQYKAEDELIDYKAEVLSMAYSQKAPMTVINAIERAKDKIGVSKAAGKYATKATTGVGGSGASGQNSDTVNTYAQLLADGKIALSNVPQNIRNAVVEATNGNINKPLSDTAIKDIQLSQSAVANLKALKGVVESNLQYVGPIQGLARFNPYSKARTVQAEIDRVRQQVGKTLEGGVLRKEDEEKYKKILATLADTPETALYKIDSLIGAIERDIELYKNLQKETGRFIPGSTGVSSPEDLRSKYNY